MTASSIITVKTIRDSGWTHLNLQVVENIDLSIQARFLHTILISRPAGWEARRQWLIEMMGSRYAFDKGAKELEEAGYLRRKQQHVGGLLTHSQYIVGDHRLDPISVPKSSTLISVPKSSTLKNSILSSDPLNSNESNNNQSIKNHLGYAGTEVPEGGKPPVDMNPHASQVRENEQKGEASLEKACELPDAYQPIVDAWARVAIKHNPVTRIMARTIPLIRKARTGTLFKGKPEFAGEYRKYSVNQIVRAIERFGQMRNDPDYLPTEKKWVKVVSLDRFFYDKFSNGNKSWFAVSIRNGLMLASDAQPELTGFVTEMYNERKGGKVAPETITRIAAKLHRYWEAEGVRLKKMGVRNERTLVTRWLSFLETEIDNWGPQHFLAAGMNAQFEKYAQR